MRSSNSRVFAVEPLARDPVGRAGDRQHVVAGQPVVLGRDHQVEHVGRDARVLDPHDIGLAARPAPGADRQGQGGAAGGDPQVGPRRGDLALGVSQRRGSQLAHQGRRPVRPLQPTRLTSIRAGTWRATASARPTAWASMPARPSEMAQMTIGSRAGAWRTGGAGGAAGSGAGVSAATCGTTLGRPSGRGLDGPRARLGPGGRARLGRSLGRSLDLGGRRRFDLGRAGRLGSFRGGGLRRRRPGRGGLRGGRLRRRLGRSLARLRRRRGRLRHWGLLRFNHVGDPGP